MSYVSMRKLAVLASVLLSFAAQADKFRWGDSNTNNRVKHGGSYAYLNSSNGRAYLYLGEAKIVNNQMSLEGLTYVCDATGSYSFGNYKDTDAYLERDLISAKGGQTYSLILVSTCAPTSVKAGEPIQPGPYYSISIKTGTSVAMEDGSGNAYASLVLSEQFTNGDCSNSGEFVEKIVPPKDGGYMWGSSVSSSYRVPNYSTGAVTTLSSSSARAYVYLGRAEYKNGAINFANLTYLTNGVPQALGGVFGNYTVPPVFASRLIQDDRVDLKGGQDFTIFIVTPDKKNKMPPNPLTDGYEANYISIQIGTSVPAVTADGAKYVQLVVDTATAVKDFEHLVPLIDVSGATFGVY